MLYDDGRIGDQRPKIVRSKARVALKMVEEGLWISVIVVIYVQTSVSAMISLAGRTPFLHVGCLTQSNFFHSFGCRLFLLVLLAEVGEKLQQDAGLQPQQRQPQNHESPKTQEDDFRSMGAAGEEHMSCTHLRVQVDGDQIWCGEWQA
jgi:hypothetical protein